LICKPRMTAAIRYFLDMNMKALKDSAAWSDVQAKWETFENDVVTPSNPVDAGKVNNDAEVPKNQISDSDPPGVMP